jgi:hypothetical protein
VTVASVEKAIEMVMREQFESYQRGALSIWTIYRCPTDWPQGFIVRKHEAGKNGKSSPTNVTIETASSRAAALHMLQHILSSAGLVCMTRDPNDDEKIVESWM